MLVGVYQPWSTVPEAEIQEEDKKVGIDNFVLLL